MTIAVLDACVLYRGTVTDFLLNAAEQGVFEPIWSQQIADEWTRNLVLRTQIPRERIDYRRNRMNDAFPEASCDAGSETLNSVIDHCRSKAEEKDAHVVATAIAAEASIIVTYNLKDFPPHILKPFGLEAMVPDDFFCDLADTDVLKALGTARAHFNSIRKPPLSAPDYLDLLSSPKADLYQTRAWLDTNGF